MAEILRYVDPNAAAGGDGTTNALSGANCAYVSQNVWEAATQQDLTDGGGDTARVVCSSDDAGSTHAADTTAVAIDGWTTGASNYITIEAASSHGGKWNDNIYRLNTSSATSTIYESYVRIIGIQFSQTASSGAADQLWITGLSATGSILIDKCISKGIFSGTANNLSAIVVSSQTQSLALNIHNTLIYDYVNGTNLIVGIYLSSTNTTINAQNLTLQNCRRGLWRDTFGTFNATNVGMSSVNTPISGTITQTTCSTTTPTFVNGAGDDFHLDAADTTWKDQGTDLSATFTDDIDGQTRPTGAGTWDIGADEYVSTAIKTILGLAKASVKTVDGLAIASVKTWGGLT